MYCCLLDYFNAFAIWNESFSSLIAINFYNSHLLNFANSTSFFFEMQQIALFIIYFSDILNTYEGL